MNPSQNDINEFGVEYFDDYIRNPLDQSQKAEEQPQQKGWGRRLFQRGADLGFFGPFFAGEDTQRQMLRSTARIGETVAGLPGDIRETVKIGSEWLGDKARSMIGKEPLSEEEKQFIQNELKPKDWNLIGKIVESFPTSSDIREGVTRKYTEDYLEPQNDWEAFSDEIVQDFASLALPSKGRIPFAKALGTSLFANAGSEVAEAFLGEDAKNYTKLGLLFSAGMVGQNKGGVKKYINNLYEEMQSEIPKGTQVSSRNLQNSLNKIESALKKGDPGAASKQESFKKINAIRNKISGGEIPLEEVLELTKDVNESIFDIGELKRSQNQLYKIREALHDTTKEYGSENASFLNKWNNANQAYAATEQSRKLSNWVKKNIRPKDYLYASSALGLGGAIVGAPASLATVAGAGAAATTAYSAEVMKRIAQSPALRRYYLNTVNSSLKQNKTSFMRNIKMLDDELKKSFESEPFETIDFTEETQ